MTILGNMNTAQKAEFKAAGDTSGLLTKDQAATGTGVTASTLAGPAAAQVAGGSVDVSAGSQALAVPYGQMSLTGALTADVVITLPSGGGATRVRNDTTGNFKLSVRRGSSGVPLTIPQNEAVGVS